MTQFVGFGNGQDGILNVTTSVTDAPVDSTFAGTAGLDTGAGATGKGFAVNDIVLIHYTRGASAGAYEVNQIQSYNSGTGAFDFTLPLVNNYLDSGADQSQVIEIKQYSSGNISASGAITAKAWDGDVGGILVFMVQAKFNNLGVLSAAVAGFRGGTQLSNNYGSQGEGTAGDNSSRQRAANGNGGGGGEKNTNQFDSGNGGGGGENAGGATPGGIHSQFAGVGDRLAGIPGNVAGTATLNLMVFGGGGGGGGNDPGPGGFGTGGRGAGIIFIMVGEFAGNGQMNAVGERGYAVSAGSTRDHSAGGGGAAGGSIKVIARVCTYSGSFDVSGGVGGVGCVSAHNSNGGVGGVGRIYIESCQNTQAYSSTTSPTIVTGGLPYCSTANQIL